jgi:methyl-accepting chemotaxis protein
VKIDGDSLILKREVVYMGILNNKRRPKFGLKAKWITYATIMTILGAAILSWFVIRHEKKIVQDELKKRGLSLAKNLAYNSEYGVLIANQTILLKLINGVMKEDDVVYCVIQDSEGQVLAQGGEIKEEGIYKAINQRAIEATEPFIQYYLSEQKEQLYDITAPISTAAGEVWEEEAGLFLEEEQEIKEGKIGVARIGISLRNTSALITKIRNEVFILTLIIIAIYIFVIVLVVNSIINPIRQLVEGTKRVGKGDLSYQVIIKSADEIGELADSFNQMTQDLKKSRDELKQWARTLEQKVAERTRELEEARNSLEIKIRERTKELQEARNNLEIKVRERTEELQKSKDQLQVKLEELERFHRLTMGRELKIIELKEKIKNLEKKLIEAEKRR